MSGAALYAEFLQKLDDQERLRLYSRSVVEATSGSGKTPVEPLATMGREGGPLLCDHCGKPMILEGGGFQGVYADEAWKRKPQPGWLSYISGGMTIETQSNGALRVYHGYFGRGTRCAATADAADMAAREAWRNGGRPDNSAKLDLLHAYIRAEMPDKDPDKHLNEVAQVLFAYDPGPGKNVP